MKILEYVYIHVPELKAFFFQKAIPSHPSPMVYYTYCTVPPAVQYLLRSSPYTSVRRELTSSLTEDKRWPKIIKLKRCGQE